MAEPMPARGPSSHYRPDGTAKTTYPCRAAAKRHANILRRQRADQFPTPRVYRCCLCTGWHIGSHGRTEA